jgi:hypothetical protein
MRDTLVLKQPVVGVVLKQPVVGVVLKQPVDLVMVVKQPVDLVMVVKNIIKNKLPGIDNVIFDIVFTNHTYKQK